MNKLEPDYKKKKKNHRTVGSTEDCMAPIQTRTSSQICGFGCISDIDYGIMLFKCEFQTPSPISSLFISPLWYPTTKPDQTKELSSAKNVYILYE